MLAPDHPITLSPEQIADLSARMSDLRHNINNSLSLIMAATELIRCRPDQAARFLNSLVDPPQQITQELTRFSNLLETLLEIPRA